MRILVGWDDADEAELIGLYLNTGEHSAALHTDRQSLLRDATQNGNWDVILLATQFPDVDTAFATFQEIHERRPQCPVVCACKAAETLQLARFIAEGLRTYVVRDAGKDFVFLLMTTLESTVKAVQAERDQQLAEQLKNEVDAVRRFQQAMIGSDLFEPMGYRTAAAYESSSIRVQGGTAMVLAGGDFYDVFPLDRSRVGIIIADAAGHGMQACLAITILQTQMQMLRNRKVRRAADFMNELNRQFCGHRIVLSLGNLTTALFAILDTDRNDLTWASAGHPPPLLHDRERQTAEPLSNGKFTDPPFGIDTDVTYHECTQRLPDRARLVFYTDGLTEASPDENSGEQFGLNGVCSTLKRLADRTAEDVVRALMNDSYSFTRGHGRHDDTSVLVVERA